MIGIEAVDGQGRVFHAGGRVVKNVAGYDLCRLLVGSRGLLGVISLVTFKLKPLAETSAIFSIGFSDVASVEAALSRLNSSAATPIVIDLATSASETGQPFVLTLAAEGSQKSCDWQREVIQQEFSLGEPITPAETQQTTLFDYCHSVDFVRRHPCLRCRPSQVALIAAEFAERGYSSIGHAGNGILYVRDDVADGNVRRVCDDVARATGSRVSEWTVDHPAASTNPLTLKARATFDPSGIFTV